MEDHIIDADRAETLEDESRYRILSREELLGEIREDDTVVDIGSGTGFFTDDMAKVARKVYAVDFQEQMHEYYREKGLPENVKTVHKRASEITIEDVDLIISILSLHEITLEKALETFSDVLGNKGKMFIVDWSANAETDNVPPREKLYGAQEASEKVSQSFEILQSRERFDTFKIVAEA